MTYSLSEYGSMIADQERMDPYVFALKAAIKPDSVVLDIGAGTGIHALLACKFGARQVYAIEPNDVAHLGRELAEVNGFADRIDFIQDLSSRVTLPERADVIVSDLRGVLPLFGSHIPSIIDARKRQLAPEGILIPKSDTLWVALVKARNVYADIVKPWDHPYGLPMEPAKQIALNSWSDANTDSIRAANLLTTPQQWATLNYSTIEDPDVGCSDIRLEVTRDGTAHGWLIWFDAELAEGIGFSCGPEEDKFAEVYGRGFFPLLEPVSIVEGDTIALTIEAELIDKEYEWRWHTRIHSQEDPGLLKADFKQATDSDNVLSLNRIAENVSNDRPSLVEEGQIDRFILGSMDGTTTNKEIAAHTRKRFPKRFKNDRDALLYVYELSRQYR
ncbi:MAG: 50S ribosomal protein L11 methyltransferase [Candidatus Promineifilaceae bacterium]